MDTMSHLANCVRYATLSGITSESLAGTLPVVLVRFVNYNTEWPTMVQIVFAMFVVYKLPQFGCYAFVTAK